MVARKGQIFGLRFCVPCRPAQTLARTSVRWRRRSSRARKFSAARPAAVTPKHRDGPPLLKDGGGRVRTPRRATAWRRTIMRDSRLLGAGIVGALGLVALLSLPISSAGQTPATPTRALAPPCNKLTDLTSTSPLVFTPIDATNKDKILKSGLPCAETVHLEGPPGKSRLENLQRGFDFYSWRTFIALNSPADGRGIDQSMPNTKTKWEDRANFKQLLDVMLEGGVPSNWEDKKQPPPGCKSQFDANPDMMVIEMIEETFNQPFKTGPLIDQQGNYALF